MPCSSCALDEALRLRRQVGERLQRLVRQQVEGDDDAGLVRLVHGPEQGCGGVVVATEREFRGGAQDGEVELPVPLGAPAALSLEDEQERVLRVAAEQREPGARHGDPGVAAGHAVEGGLGARELPEQQGQVGGVAGEQHLRGRAGDELLAVLGPGAVERAVGLHRVAPVQAVAVGGVHRERPELVVRARIGERGEPVPGVARARAGPSR